MVELSIILPTYNEKENIGLLVQGIEETLERISYEIIIVDDSSPDGTGEFAKNISKTNKNVKTIIRTRDKGLANSIKEGIKESKGKKIVIMDTDFSHPPKDILRLLENIQNADIIIASRYVRHGSMETPWHSWHKYFGSYVLNKTVNMILGLEVKDSTNGFILLKQEVLNNLDLDKIFVGYGDFCFRLLYYLNKHKKEIKEIPFRYNMRLHGQSKTNLIKIGFSYLYQALKIRLGF